MGNRGKIQVHVAMLGARQHYALPLLLQRSGMLGLFYTDLYLKNRVWWNPFLTHCSDEELSPNRVVSFDAFGMWYRWVLRKAKHHEEAEGIYVKAAILFAQKVTRHGLPGADALYSYNGPSAELFEYAKHKGIVCILEQIHVSQTIARSLL